MLSVCLCDCLSLWCVCIAVVINMTTGEITNYQHSTMVDSMTIHVRCRGEEAYVGAVTTSLTLCACVFVVGVTEQKVNGQIVSVDIVRLEGNSGECAAMVFVSGRGRETESEVTSERQRAQPSKPTAALTACQCTMLPGNRVRMDSEILDVIQYTVQGYTSPFTHTHTATPFCPPTSPHHLPHHHHLQYWYTWWHQDPRLGH